MTDPQDDLTRDAATELRTRKLLRASTDLALTTYRVQALAMALDVLDAVGTGLRAAGLWDVSIPAQGPGDAEPRFFMPVPKVVHELRRIVAREHRDARHHLAGGSPGIALRGTLVSGRADNNDPS